MSTKIITNEQLLEVRAAYGMPERASCPAARLELARLLLAGSTAWTDANLTAYRVKKRRIGGGGPTDKGKKAKK